MARLPYLARVAIFGSLAALFKLLMAESGYEKYVKAEAGALSRWRNLGELATIAAGYAVHELQDFLDQVGR